MGLHMRQMVLIMDERLQCGDAQGMNALIERLYGAFSARYLADTISPTARCCLWTWCTRSGRDPGRAR